MAKISNFTLSIGGAFYTHKVVIVSGKQSVTINTTDGAGKDTALDLCYIAQAIKDGSDSWDDSTKTQAGKRLAVWLKSLPASAIVRFHLPNDSSKRDSFTDDSAWVLMYESTIGALSVMADVLLQADDKRLDFLKSIAALESDRTRGLEVKTMGVAPTLVKVATAKKAGSTKTLPSLFK